jgi:hypothetical protein
VIRVRHLAGARLEGARAIGRGRRLLVRAARRLAVRVVREVPDHPESARPAREGGLSIYSTGEAAPPESERQAPSGPGRRV